MNCEVGPSLFILAELGTQQALNKYLCVMSGLHWDNLSYVRQVANGFYTLGPFLRGQGEGSGLRGHLVG